MSEKKNYAKFRSELLNLCPGMDEREVYLKWWKYQFRDSTWEIHQKPTCGCDRKYHMVYITITGLGKIYVGVHSTSDLCDGYLWSFSEQGAKPLPWRNTSLTVISSLSLGF